MKFIDLPIDPTLVDGIGYMGFEETTPIQEQTIPLILDKQDLIACAQTGTGKTAAYLIPTLHHLSAEESEHTRGLILAPTRELAGQIDQNIEALSYFTGVSSMSVIGGKNSESWERQRFAVTNGADIIVATPGRLITLLALNLVNFDHLEMVILDEADKMLDMGFFEDIMKIISYTPEERQTLMFSATMPRKIRELAKKILKNPQEVNLNLAKPAEGISQSAYMVFDQQKIPLLEHLIKVKEIDSMIIFASSKASVDLIELKLSRLNYDVRAMHSDKSQEERQETLREFKNKKFPIIVGTDVLARGIDIDNLSHVLNFDVPHDAEDYVHRVGRTARASKTGEAITFITPRDQHKFVRIEQLIETDIPKPQVPESLGEAPIYNPKSRGHGRGSHPRKRNNQNRNRNRRRKPGGGDRNRRNDNASQHRKQGRHSSNQNGKSNAPKDGEKSSETTSSPTNKRNRNRRRKRNKNRNPEQNSSSPNSPTQNPTQQPPDKS
ncbi:MAG: DEAD/DEAH box helicase [Bacteroidota bacterium]